MFSLLASSKVDKLMLIIVNKVHLLLCELIFCIFFHDTVPLVEPGGASLDRVTCHKRAKRCINESLGIHSALM